MKQKLRKFLSTLLALTMALSLLPTSAFAYGDYKPEQPSVSAPSAEAAATVIGQRVYVRCLNDYSHGWKTFNATAGSIEIGETFTRDGWIYCMVTVKAASYVNSYTEGSKTHTLAGNDSQSLTLWYNGWTKTWNAFSNSYVTFYVTCEDDTETPGQPTTKYYPVYVYARVFDTSNNDISGSNTLHGTGAINATLNSTSWITLGKLNSATTLNPSDYQSYDRPALTNGTHNLAIEKTDEYNTIVAALNSYDMSYYSGNTGITVADVESWEVVTASGATDYSNEASSRDTTWHLDGKITAYKLTYKANGGTGSDVVDQYYLKNATTSVLTSTFTAPTGMEFVGWNTAADGSGTAYAADDSVTFGAQDITLYAQWKPAKPTEDDVVNLFTSGVTVDCVNTEVSHDNADYNLERGTFSIGEVTGDKTNGYQCVITLTDLGTYVTKYNTATSGHTKETNGHTTTVTLTWDTTAKEWKNSNNAKFLVKVGCETPTYTIVYHGNEGKTDKDHSTTNQTAKVGQSVTLKGSDTFTRECYEFVEWNTAADGKGTSYTASATANFSDVTAGGTVDLYAIWKISVKSTVDCAVLDPDGNAVTDATVAVYRYYSVTTTGAQSELIGTATYNSESQKYELEVDYTKFADNDWIAVTVAVNNGTLSFTEFAKCKNPGMNTWPLSSNDTFCVVSKGENSAFPKYPCFEAHFTCQAYAVTYDANDGTGSIDGQIKTTGNSVTLKASTGFSKENHVFTGWNTAANGTGTAYSAGDVYSADANLTLYAQWEVDNWKDDPNGGKDSETGGDGIPDKYQALVKFAAKDNGAVSGTGTVQVFTMEKDSNGGYESSMSVTPSLSDVTVTANDDYAFDIWTKDSETEGVNPESAITVKADSTTTFYANFAEDKIGVDDPTKGDDIPDVYQATVTYEVKNGKWTDNDTAADKKYVFTLKEKNDTTGKWEPISPTPVLGSTIPSANANTGYTSEGGGWNAAINDYTTVTKDVTYTYTFLKIGSATFNPNTETWEDQDSKYTGIFFKELTGYLPSGYSETFEITLKQIKSSNSEIEVISELADDSTNATVYKGKVTMTAADTKQFICDTMTFDEPGTYTFHVTETEPEDANDYITYDDAAYTLIIEVGYADADDGSVTIVAPGGSVNMNTKPEEKKAQLEVKDWYFKVSAGNGDFKDVKQQVTFENSSSYVPNVNVDLTALGLVKKNYISTYGYGDTETFNFVATIAPQQSEGSYTVNGSVNLSTGETELVNFDKVTLPVGTYTVTVTETPGTRSDVTYATGTYSFTLFVHDDGEVTAETDGTSGIFLNSYDGYVYVPVNPEPTVKVKGLDTVNHVAYIVGRDTGLVDPNGTITRAEVATIYFRLMTEEFRNQYWSNECSYTDVADTAWYNVAIATLEKAGVIKDTATGGSFRPNEPITRAELAVMAAQFCTVTGTIPKTSFTDIPSTYWAAKEIALVEFAGWIEGYQGKFRPDDNLTRAECVTIVNRMLNRGAEAENMLDDMVTFPDNPVVKKDWYYEAIQEAANSHTYSRTNKLLTGEHFNGEKWTALQTAPDWAAMEQAWANANRK